MPAFLLPLLSWLIRILVPALMQSAQDTAEIGDAREDRERMRRLRAKWAAAGMLALVACASAGCFTRTVYIEPGEPVMLRQEVKGVRIWARDKDGKRVPGTIDLREGWLAGPAEPME